MILTEADQPHYFADLTIAPAHLTIQLRRAQQFAEGVEGAQRPLERQEFTETIAIAQNQTGQLSRWPIELENPVPAIEGMIGTQGRYRERRRSIYNAGHQVAIEGWKIDPIEGQLALGAAFGRACFVQVTATYTAGWDFQAEASGSETDPDVVAIKVAVTNILRQLVASPGLPAPVTGVQSASEQNRGSVSVKNPAAGSINPDLYLPFHKYRPRC